MRREGEEEDKLGWKRRLSTRMLDGVSVWLLFCFACHFLTEVCVWGGGAGGTSQELFCLETMTRALTRFVRALAFGAVDGMQSGNVRWAEEKSIIKAALDRQASLTGYVSVVRSFFLFPPGRGVGAAVGRRARKRSTYWMPHLVDKTCDREGKILCTRFCLAPRILGSQ